MRHAYKMAEDVQSEEIHMRNVSVLRQSLASVAMGLVLMAAVPAMADEKRITVNGEASVDRAPDMATISIGVTTVAETAAAALAGNSKDMAAVIERLKASGIGAGDLQTNGISVNPNWSSTSSSGGASQIDGFTAANTLTVAIRDVNALGTILDASVADGANTLYGVTFGLADNRPVLDEARKAAVKDARAKAELLAEAAGVKLGDLVSITEGGGYGGPMPMFKADAASAVPVEQGQVSTQASVAVSWEIAD